MQNELKKRFTKGIFLSAVFSALFFAVSCNNIFHELIPPADSEIHSFAVIDTDKAHFVAKKDGSSNIVITVPENTDVTSLLPVVQTDEKSTVLPITLPYIHRAFPSADLMTLAVQINDSLKYDGLNDWMMNFIRENSGSFSIPAIDEPVDFTQPVVFCVISGRGNCKVYTVTVVRENSGNPDNPDIPPGTETEKNIISFEVLEPKQTKPSVIGDSSVTFTMNAGTDISALNPVVTVSEGAGILPLTQDYLLKYLSYPELISFYSGYSTAADINAFVSSAVKKLSSSEITEIMESGVSLPVDFSGSGSVPFAVIGSDRTAKVYLVSCEFDKNTVAITSFAITKIRNPGLMGNAEVRISENEHTIEATAVYPAEYSSDIALIPDIVIEGDSWEITGDTLTAQSVEANTENAEYTAGLTNPVKLIPSISRPFGYTYSATVTVRRGQTAVTYTLTITYTEDPDTIRSITDFRFRTVNNPGICTTAMASISNDGDTGFISASVLYRGDEIPYDLIADFNSPGTCTVEHVEQVSGVTKNNFQNSIQILCTSKNGLRCRLYTVQITFVKVKNAHAALNRFSFPKHLNPELTFSAEGVIDEASSTVYITVKYHTTEKPAKLVPEFASTGAVSVNDVLQSSGYSTQDFSRSVYYAVHAENDWSSDSRKYRISINYERDDQSACIITDFGFAADDNSSLSKDIKARITERDGTIYALLPKGADRTNLYAYFTAKGTVTVNGSEQTSRRTANDFSETVVYTVTSANGLFSKDYVVTVHQQGDIIYVNADASGMRDGTCWQDAYITLGDAFAEAEQYGDAPKEIWIAHCNGRAYNMNVNYSERIPLVPNTTIRGGFDGTEKKAEERRTKPRSAVFKETRRKTELCRAEICDTQTKIKNNGTYLFSTKRASPGEIVFDGIEISGLDVAGYRSLLCFAITDCNFSGDINTGKDRLDGDDISTNIFIDNSTVSGAFIAGNVKISDSRSIDSIQTGSSAVEFTANTAEGNANNILDFSSAQSLIFTGNTCTGAMTTVRARNIKEFTDNTFDTFVHYDISVGNGKQPDFPSMGTIKDVGKPLYNSKKEPVKKKMYISLADADDASRDWVIENLNSISGLSLTNMDCTLSGVTLLDKDLPCYSYADGTYNTLSGTPSHTFKVQGLSTAHILGSTIESVIGEYFYGLPTLTTDSLGNTRTQIRSFRFNGYAPSLSNTDFNGNNWGDPNSRYTCNFRDSGSPVKINHCSFNGIDISMPNATITCSSFGKTPVTANKSITITDSTFSNSPVAMGYSDYTNATLTISNSHFNSSPVNARKSTATISNSSFSNATLGEWEGAVRVAGTATITGCNFTNNTATQGHAGAVLTLEGSNVTVSGCTFTGNTVQNSGFRGGAICAYDSITVKDCAFINNKSYISDSFKAGAGAITISCHSNNIRANISGCTFRCNSGKGKRGDDIFMSQKWGDGPSYSGGVLYLTNCKSDAVIPNYYYQGDSVYTDGVSVQGSMQPW